MKVGGVVKVGGYSGAGTAFLHLFTFCFKMSYNQFQNGYFWVCSHTFFVSTTFLNKGIGPTRPAFLCSYSR